jgi:hypothetical protein
MNDKIPLITPTVGRVVWFRPKNTEFRGDNGNCLCHDGIAPLAALVAYVHSDTVVNLSVIDHAGRQFPVTSVTLVQDGDPTENLAFYAEWMPYQKGQAAKTEALVQGIAKLETAAGKTCKGTNCGATDGVSHSPECLAEHEVACAIRAST